MPEAPVASSPKPSNLLILKASDVNFDPRTFKPLKKYALVPQVLVTPALAETMLSFNTDNRRCGDSAIDNVARTMERGEHLYGHQSVVSFTSDGVLTDAQTRLKAIIKSGVAVYMDVRFGQDDSRHTLDNGRRRGASQQYAYMIGEPNLPTVTGTRTRAIASIFNPSLAHRQHGVSDIAAIMAEFGDGVRTVNRLVTRNTEAGRAAVAGALAIALQAFPRKASELAKAIATHGALDTEGRQGSTEALQALRKFIFGGITPRTPDAEIGRRILYGVFCFLENEEVDRLQGRRKTSNKRVLTYFADAILEREPASPVCRTFMALQAVQPRLPVLFDTLNRELES